MKKCEITTDLDGIILLREILHTHEKTHQVPFDISFMVKVYILISNNDYINNLTFLSDKHFSIL
jgi:hypothetical protein